MEDLFKTCFGLKGTSAVNTYIKFTKKSCWVMSGLCLNGILFLQLIGLLKNKKPTRCHLLFYCTSYRLNIFRALLCPSSGARDYDVDYHIGPFVLGLL